MILALFLVLMLIAIVLIVIGLWSGESAYSIIGFIFIFFLASFIFMTGNITYQTGTNISVSYSYTSGVLNTSVIVAIDNYIPFNDSTSKWFGRWLAIISVIGLVLSLIEGARNINPKKREDD